MGLVAQIRLVRIIVFDIEKIPEANHAFMVFIHMPIVFRENNFTYRFFQLMAKLAEGTGFQIPQAAATALNMPPAPAAPAPVPGIPAAAAAAPAAQQQQAPPIATQCFMLSNMFDPAT